MSKQNISATVDPEVADFVSRDEVNTSGLVNKLLEQHMSGGTGEEQMLEFRIQQVESDIESLEGQLEVKRNERDELVRRQNDLQDETDEILQEAANTLTEDDLRPDNTKVHYWADEAGMEVEAFLERVETLLQ